MTVRVSAYSSPCGCGRPHLIEPNELIVDCLGKWLKVDCAIAIPR